MTGQQLKNSILQMAVQGKLVPQDPNDEPASVLLERIRTEKEQLIKEGKIKKEMRPSIIFRGADNLPYETVGKTLDKAKNQGDYKPYLCSINVYWNGIDLTKVKEARFEENEISKYKLKKGDLLICEGGDVGRSAIWENDQEMYYQNALHRVRFYGGINPYYFRLLMECYKGNKILDKKSKGMTIKHLVQTALNSIYFPLPPIQEQQRIVDKFQSLIPILEQYNTSEIRLSNLNIGFPDLLKKSILQEAVQGKLVPQDPNDEPASVLLECIRAEKQRLIAEGKIKKDKHESIIFRRDNSHYEKRGSEEFCIDEELPFDLPDTWSWARLGELCSVVTGRLDANAQTLDGKYAFFTCGREVFRTDTYAFDCDAILLGGNNASGDYKMHRYSGKFNAYQRVYVISGREPDFLNYLYYVITFWLGHLKKNSQGTTTRFIKLGQVTGMLVPVPPCAEQKHIIQTIQLLLNECDHLQ